LPTYTRTTLLAVARRKISGTIADSDAQACCNDAVREVLSDADLRSAKRKSALSPNLFDDVFDYTLPTDLKRNAIVDIRPQIQRGRFDDWRMTTEEEFDRLKEDNRLDQWGDPIKLGRSQWLGDSICAISDDDMVRKLKISRPIDDKATTIDTLDAVGNWVVMGDGTNLTKDSDDYVKGSASLNWDISAVGGTTAGIYNESVAQFDITDYLTGSVFVWAYITSATYLTNFILRLGSSSSAYYSITITTNNEGTAFYAGWNLLRFDLANRVATGTVDEDTCDYVAIYMTKNALKISETDYRFDSIVLRKGDHYELVYYSKYGWQSSTGTFLENSTADGDYLNLDTDEIDLIEYKTAELMEEFLKNLNQADRLQKKYLFKIGEYIKNNPSEAMILTTVFHSTIL
jgi:hypothetical protein